METRYKEPSLEELQIAIKDLANSTSLRKATIAEVQLLATQTADPKVLIGAILFCIEKITLEYSVREPASALYKDLIEKVLRITPENPITEEERLVYLNHYYNYRKTRTRPEEESKKPGATLDKEFQSAVDSVLSRTLKLKTALIKRPDLEHLTSQVALLPQAYRAKCSTRFWNPNVDHQKIMLFIEFLSTSEANVILLNFSKCKSTEEDGFKQYQYTIFYGALLHTMLLIEREYSNSVRATENSDLYNCCRRALNIESIEDVPAIFRLNFFADLRRFQRAVIADTQAITVLNKTIVRPAGYIQSEILFTDAQRYIEKQANSIEALIQSETFLWKCAVSALNYAAFTAVGIFCFEAATAGYALGIGRGVLVNLGRQLGGFLLRGPWGEYLGAACAARYEKDAIVGSLTSTLVYAFNYLQQRVRGEQKSILDDVKAADDFRAGELKEEIRIEAKNEAEKIALQREWFKAVTSLPSKLSAEVKDRVRETIVAPVAMPDFNFIETEEAGDFIIVKPREENRPSTTMRKTL